jgi:hypothetical protein
MRKKHGLLNELSSAFFTLGIVTIGQHFGLVNLAEWTLTNGIMLMFFGIGTYLVYLSGRMRK